MHQCWPRQALWLCGLSSGASPTDTRLVEGQNVLNVIFGQGNDSSLALVINSGQLRPRRVSVAHVLAALSVFEGSK